MGGVGSFIEDTTGLNTSTNSRADQALRAQQEAAGQATGLQREMFNQIREDQSPFREAGGTALSELASGNFMENWQQDPGYQFRMQEGMKAIENSAAARGALNSGATLKALTGYGQNLAAQEYGNIHNREYNRLSQLAGLGQNAAAMTGNAGMNYAQQAGNNMMGAANASAAAAMGQNAQMNNAIGTGIGLAFSDRRLKKNIKPVSVEDLRELKAAIKPYHFNYISEDFGEGDWIGIMAQDIEHTKLGRTVIFEDEFGQKRVNFPKLLSLLVTTFAEEAA